MIEAELAPVEVVTTFLHRLEAADVDAAVDLLDADVVYENVSLPTIRGREKVRKAFSRMFGLNGAGFGVTVHKATTDGRSVLTERTDVLYYKRFRLKVWVCGRFDVVDGRITLWRDYFDWWNVASATVRALPGLLRPAQQQAQ